MAASSHSESRQLTAPSRNNTIKHIISFTQGVRTIHIVDPCPPHPQSNLFLAQYLEKDKMESLHGLSEDLKEESYPPTQVEPIPKGQGRYREGTPSPLRKET